MVRFLWPLRERRELHYVPLRHVYGTTFLLHRSFNTGRGLRRGHRVVVRRLYHRGQLLNTAYAIVDWEVVFGALRESPYHVAIVVAAGLSRPRPRTRRR